MLGAVKSHPQKHVVLGYLDGFPLLTHFPWKHGLQVTSQKGCFISWCWSKEVVLKFDSLAEKFFKHKSHE